MAQLDYMTLQERYGGLFVAERNGEVIASAETYDSLSDELERADVDWDGIVIGYVDPVDVIRV